MPSNGQNKSRGAASSSSSTSAATNSSTDHSEIYSRQPTPITRQSIVSEDTPMFGNSNNPVNYQSTQNAATPNGNGNQDHYHDEPQQSQQEQRDNIGQDNASSSPPKNTPWYKRVSDKYGSLELENKGSVARDHLALERTFLSWLRTSLAFASIGIAVTQLFRLNTAIRNNNHPSVKDHHSHPSLLVSSEDYTYSSSDDKNKYYYTLSEGDDRIRSLGKPLGATFIGIAIVILTIGFHRYFESQYWVVRGKFPASRGSVAIVAFITGSLMISSLVVILTISPSATES